MQLLFLLFVLFKDFLHNLLRHEPILHFRFGLAVLCIGAFLSFQKHRILCVQLADARELFVRTVLFLIGIKSRAAQKSRRCTPCGMISCFIRLFSLAILVPRVLLACFLRSKTDHFRGPRTAPKALNFPANRRRETYRKVGKIIACWTLRAWCWPRQISGDFFAFRLIFGLILQFFCTSDSNFYPRAWRTKSRFCSLCVPCVSLPRATQDNSKERNLVAVLGVTSIFETSESHKLAG